MVANPRICKVSLEQEPSFADWGMQLSKGHITGPMYLFTRKMRMTKLFKTVKLTTISNCIGWYFANDTDILYILDDFDVHESHRISRKYHKPEIWRKFHRNSRKMLLLDFYWIFICLVWLILMISFCFWFLEFHDAYSMIPGSMISYAVRFCDLSPMKFV